MVCGAHDDRVGPPLVGLCWPWTSSPIQGLGPDDGTSQRGGMALAALAKHWQRGNPVRKRLDRRMVVNGDAHQPCVILISPIRG